MRDVDEAARGRSNGLLRRFSDSITIDTTLCSVGLPHLRAALWNVPNLDQVGLSLRAGWGGLGRSVREWVFGESGKSSPRVDDAWPSLWSRFMAVIEVLRNQSLEVWFEERGLFGQSRADELCSHTRDGVHADDPFGKPSKRVGRGVADFREVAID